jgi:NADH dehydrogenase
MKAIFVTGASGFVGRHLVPALATSHRVVCLARTVPAAAPAENVQWIAGDLNAPATYEDALAGVHSVVHLAALTGKARAEQYQRTNVAGTEQLLAACRGQRVANFLHVSSVAVKFPQLHAYPYGESKRQAEEAVRASGLRWAIVRPAIILGPGSPAWTGLAPLVKLPLTPMFGGGHNLVQPVHVVDVAWFLAQILERELFSGGVFECGGPQVVPFRALAEVLGRKLTGHPPRLMPVPLAPVALLLSMVEPLLFSLLPITAGQLSSFRYSGVMESNPLWEERRPHLLPLERML